MKNKFFEESEKNKLAAMLIDLSIHELNYEEDRCERKGYFKKALEVQKVKNAITTVLEYIDK